MNETVADRHRRLATAFRTVVEAVTDDQLTFATPCDDWTVADVIDHVVATQRDFLVERGLPIDEPEGSPAQRVATMAAAMQTVLDDPVVADRSYEGYFGPTTISETVDAFYCLDLVVHRWDLATAVGLTDHAIIPDADVDRCRHLLAPMGDNVRMPGIFGTPVELASSPTMTEAFVAWTGRDPAFTPD